MLESQDLATHRVRVWDLPTRLFHWLLAAGVVGLFITGKMGGNALDWHMRIGLAVGALLLFRLVWGFIGGRWSRFVQFVRGPSALLRYLRGRPEPGDAFHVGHNPLGALSVLAMLLVLAAQVGTGLVSDDEIAVVGPLNRFVDSAVGLAAMGWHRGYGQYAIMALVGLHVAAIAWYSRKGQHLVPPMITGDKLLADEVAPSRDGAAAWLRAVVLAVVCAAVAIGVSRLGA